MTTTLTLDALYFAAARSCLARARQSQERVEAAIGHFERLCGEEQEILRLSGAPDRYLDRLEPIWVQMEGAYVSTAYAYSPLLESLASTHVLCVMALESHINARALDLLSGKLRDKFDWTDLEFKWLAFPRLLGKEGFDPGAEPFQSFSMLMKFRNGLVHYKKRKEEFRYPGVPQSLATLGLTLPDAARSLSCVCGMLSALAHRLNEDTPEWLNREDAEVNCFEFDVSSAEGERA